MNALAAYDDPSPVPHLMKVAVRLADEGIPVRAIARSTKLPSEDVYEILREAIAAGSIVEMPKDDWPIGSTRGQRTAFQGTPLDNDDALQIACARFFKVTKLEAAIFTTLLKRNEVTRQQLHAVIEQTRSGEATKDATDPKMVDVIICHLRKKLKPPGIEIETIWGIGYLVPAADRKKAISLLTTFVSSEAG